MAVMVNTNGVVIAPTNFAAANGLGTNAGGGLASNLSPAKIFIGNALSNAAAQTVSGDISLATNGAATLAATGTAGTYAQVTTDAKGRVISGTATLPIGAGGTGQTTAGAALNALSGASLTSSNTISGGSYISPLRIADVRAGVGLNAATLTFDGTTNISVRPDS